jgi:hypothetical protein
MVPSPGGRGGISQALLHHMIRQSHACLWKSSAAGSRSRLKASKNLTFTPIVSLIYLIFRHFALGPRRLKRDYHLTRAAFQIQSLPGIGLASILCNSEVWSTAVGFLDNYTQRVRDPVMAP